MKEFMQVLVEMAALAAGGGIGYVFGAIQNAAQRRNQKQEETGNFKSAWRLMPGSGARVMLLLVALVLVQIICPHFFADGTKWWVSGGVAAGYGLALYQQLRQRRASGV